MSTQSHLVDPDADALAAVVESGVTGPDRCTVYPRDLPEADRTTTWLTVNASVLCDLDDHR
ncbi:DUF7511 domain-containing protein [Halocalculus aciditolerans]|uniref:DUF7511 domain-containing protein n=1 Tax=Halocalculus aciditolerans TaxID=1383812 RepID=A0A830F1W3_9EURY|nr:hypothetical protein [Halocalculus aciditolerans]GGL53808.1 hypothetical protein GCM10009039_09980 [Halocalculus aciditolerans]